VSTYTCFRGGVAATRKRLDYVGFRTERNFLYLRPDRVCIPDSLDILFKIIH